jgi:hypothetical protein
MRDKPKYQLVFERQEAIDRVAVKLTDQHWTRMTMLLVVSGAALVGFLTSVILLWMGLRYMPFRYALACLASYGVFLSLMNRWLGHHSQSWLVDRTTDVVNPADVADGVFRSGSRVLERASDGIFGRGRSGGGGASASFDAGVVAPESPPLPVFTASSSASRESGGFSLGDVDADDALPLVAIAAIAAIVIACASVIWQSPQMIAELLADGAVAGVAYKGLRASGDWTMGVIRRTWLAASVILVIFVLLGIAGHALKPSADSIGDFFR